VAPLGFRQAFLSAQPVAVRGGLIPGNAQDGTVRFGAAVHLVMAELRAETLELRYRHALRRQLKTPGNSPPVQPLVRVMLGLAGRGTHPELHRAAPDNHHGLTLAVDVPGARGRWLRREFLVEGLESICLAPTAAQQPIYRGVDAGVGI